MKQTAFDLWMKGWTAKRIAEKLKISVGATYSRINRERLAQGCPPGSRAFRGDAEREDFVARWNSGQPLDEIATEMGFGKGEKGRLSVRQYAYRLRKAGHDLSLRGLIKPPAKRMAPRKKRVRV